MTAATSPLAVFAGLAIALLVLKLTRPATNSSPAPATETATEPTTEPVTATALLLLASAASRGTQTVPQSVQLASPEPLRSIAGATGRTLRLAQDEQATVPDSDPGSLDRPYGTPAADSRQSRLLGDARAILAKANAHGIRLTQRGLAKELRHRGHKVPNAKLKHISTAIGLATASSDDSARSPAAGLDAGIGHASEPSRRADPLAPTRTGRTNGTKSFAQLTHAHATPTDLDVATSPKLPFRHNRLIRTRDAG